MVGEIEPLDHNTAVHLSRFLAVQRCSEKEMKPICRFAPPFFCLSVVLALGCATGQHMSSPGPTVVDADAPAEFTTTPSGLKYKVLRLGDGSNPRASDEVTVNYKGWLNSGRVFDNSYDKEPISFRLREVVPGWTEGLQLVTEGGMIELEIPPELGYGAQSPPGIPPNSTLHFIVELIKVH